MAQVLVSKEWRNLDLARLTWRGFALFFRFEGWTRASTPSAGMLTEPKGDGRTIDSWDPPTVTFERARGHGAFWWNAMAEAGSD